QEDCRDAIADLRMFASSETQEAAWAAMEALSESFNLLVAGDQAASDRAFQGYEESFARFATALNRELEEINHMLYAYQTRLWRAVLNRVRGEPLPFQISTSADPGTALSGPGEERIPIQ
ncbi:MAG TPA: hypothetical protein VG078_11100, partial [Acidimicrobiales bacterium]|nr:hypothetical protein [Acidimicrobiales bacterium]